MPDDQPRGAPRGFGVQSDSIKFIAGADGIVVRMIANMTNAPPNGTPNIIDVQRGPGEILEYLHLKTGSSLVALNDTVSRDQKLGIVSNVGGGTPHLHFAVITRIDNAYVTRPAYFVSYCVSKDFGQTWEFLAAGMPTNGQWVKRASTQLPAC
ncbi:MAG: M23 family metallopeptidase [Gemmatimonadota bacterium]